MRGERATKGLRPDCNYVLREKLNLIKQQLTAMTSGQQGAARSQVVVVVKRRSEVNSSDRQQLKGGNTTKLNMHLTRKVQKRAEDLAWRVLLAPFELVESLLMLFAAARGLNAAVKVDSSSRWVTSFWAGTAAAEEKDDQTNNTVCAWRGNLEERWGEETG